jgi:hypothetical protein
MFWFDKDNDSVVFGDIRHEGHTLCDGRSLNIKPDIQMDYKALPFACGQFDMVVFDPPHLDKIGENAWMALKYGKLSKDWRTELERGFAECFRVLRIGGTLIFKWNETQIPVSEVLNLAKASPLFGHKRVGKTADTHWLCFAKGLQPETCP